MMRVIEPEHESRTDNPVGIDLIDLSAPIAAR